MTPTELAGAAGTWKPHVGGLLEWAERTGRHQAKAPGRGGLRFVFYGRVSTEDYQDPVTSQARQLGQAGALVAGHGQIVARFFDSGQSRTLAWARRPQAARDAVAKAAAQLGEPGPASVSIEAVSGVPAEELLDAARDADMIVVGSRGAGGFSRLLIGSVSTQITHHAHCPVVVVRPADPN